MTIDRLLIIWGAPSDGGRHVVGHLARDRSAGVFRFWYEPDLSAALRHGFAPLAAFPRHQTQDSPYEARYLFATFADRIPSPQRSDAKAMLASWGVEHADDQFEILAKSGGLRATDRIELAEYRADDDPLEVPLEFRVAGTKYVASEVRATLEQGAQLHFEREPTNAFDPHATIIATTSDGKRAGYVPRQYSSMVSRLLDSGASLTGIALRELIIPEDAGRWIVRVSRNS
jgi:HIRAN domain